LQDQKKLAKSKGMLGTVGQKNGQTDENVAGLGQNKNQQIGM
jgi:hypothetical protein